ncbi:MAG: hypothetical protein SNJ70_04190 [Armatimonadota bacterium]
METQKETRKSFLQKRITLKVFLIILAIIIILFFVLLIKQFMITRNIISYANKQIIEISTQSAENMARSIAVVGNEYLLDENYEQMQRYVDDLVKTSNIAYIAVLDKKNIAKVHTNRNDIGKKLDDLNKDKNMIHVSVPVMSFTEQIGIVAIGTEQPSSISSIVK